MGGEKAKGTVAYEALGLIQYIYRRDNELKDLKPGERKRKILIQPLVDDFFRWIREVQPQVSRSHLLTEIPKHMYDTDLDFLFCFFVKARVVYRLLNLRY